MMKTTPYSATSQSTYVDTRMTINVFLHLYSDMAAISNTTFLAKVSQFDKTTASPKQPQSDIGLAMASHSVSGVISDITSNTKVGATLR